MYCLFSPPARSEADVIFDSACALVVVVFGGSISVFHVVLSMGILSRAIWSPE